MSTRLAWFFIATVLACASACAAEARVDVQFTPATPSLSDPIHLEVTLTRGDGADLVLRPVSISPDCVTVQALRYSDDRARASLTLDPIQAGPCRIPAFRTQCLHSNAPGCDVRSAETVISIGSMIPSGVDKPDIRDGDELPLEIASAKTVSAAPHPGLWLRGTAAVVGGAIWIWLRRRMRPVSRALAGLRRVEFTNPADSFAQLTTIFRRYLDLKLTMDAVSSTSPELIDALRARAICSTWAERMLCEFLATCDRMKFAGCGAEVAEFEVARRQCVALVEALDAGIERRSRAGV